MTCLLTKARYTKRDEAATIIGSFLSSNALTTDYVHKNEACSLRRWLLFSYTTPLDPRLVVKKHPPSTQQSRNEWVAKSNPAKNSVVLSIFPVKSGCVLVALSMQHPGPETAATLHLVTKSWTRTPTQAIICKVDIVFQSQTPR